MLVEDGRRELRVKMRGRSKTPKLEFVDLGGLRRRIRKIQKRKAGVYARRRHPGERK
jgi:hypothetical protein